ncbi:MAG: 4Fe-4S binding protein [Actinobacteria bacterium]|jgi:polyferredoxin|nr:MAG: 4Fe-4S binding protein [Actinomycetota bacterium]
MFARRVTQVVSALAINPYFVYFSSRVTYQGGVKGVCVPGLNCYACPLTIFACPIGSLQHSFVLMSPKVKGSLSQAFASLIYVLASIGLVGAVVGRMPCGWVCPFGFLQELLHAIPTPKLRLPGWIRWGRYGFLVVVAIAIPFITAVSWFSRLCPAGALEGGIFLKAVPPEAPLPPSGWFFWFKIAILAAFLLWFVFSKRPFCRSVCPLGAMFGLCNRFSLYRMAVDDSKCTVCGKCREVCPVDINIHDDPNSPDCIRCLQCKKACTYGAITSGFAVAKEGLRLGKKAVSAEGD